MEADMGLSGKSGFTLIELILVTVIIGILAGMVTVIFTGQAEVARKRAAKGDISNYTTAVDLYALNHGDTLPASLDTLEQAGNIKELKPDPWGNDYVYKPNGNKYDIFSAGPDGLPGTKDDVTTKSAIEIEK